MNLGVDLGCRRIIKNKKDAIKVALVSTTDTVLQISKSELIRTILWVIVSRLS